MAKKSLVFLRTMLLISYAKGIIEVQYEAPKKLPNRQTYNGLRA